MRILICDDHVLFAEALASVLVARGHDVVACVAAPDAAVRVAGEVQVDVCVMDLTFPAGSGTEGTAKILQASPGTKVVVLTGSSGAADLAGIASAGAQGFATKGDDLERVMAVLEQVHDGETVTFADNDSARPIAAIPTTNAAGFAGRFLTRRERQVLEHLALGTSTAELTRALGVKSSTARTHIQNTLNKLGVHSKLEAVVYAVTNGLVPFPAARAANDQAVGAPRALKCG